MKLDVYQCPVCFNTETEPAGQVRIFLETCPRCRAANMEKIETAVNGPEYDETTKEKMKKLKKSVWRFI
jgi:hypothetical protein